MLFHAREAVSVQVWSKFRRAFQGTLPATRSQTAAGAEVPITGWLRLSLSRVLPWQVMKKFLVVYPQWHYVTQEQNLRTCDHVRVVLAGLHATERCCRRLL